MKQFEYLLQSCLSRNIKSIQDHYNLISIQHKGIITKMYLSFHNTNATSFLIHPNTQIYLFCLPVSCETVNQLHPSLFVVETDGLLLEIYLHCQQSSFINQEIFIWLLNLYSINVYPSFFTIHGSKICCCLRSTTLLV